MNKIHISIKQKLALSVTVYFCMQHVLLFKFCTKTVQLHHKISICLRLKKKKQNVFKLTITPFLWNLLMVDNIQQLFVINCCHFCLKYILALTLNVFFYFTQEMKMLFLCYHKNQQFYDYGKTFDADFHRFKQHKM